MRGKRKQPLRLGAKLLEEETAMLTEGSLDRVRVGGLFEPARSARSSCPCSVIFRMVCA